MRYSGVGHLPWFAASVLAILYGGVGQSFGQSANGSAGTSNVWAPTEAQLRIEPAEAKRGEVVTVQGLTAVPDVIWLCPAARPIDNRQPCSASGRKATILSSTPTAARFVVPVPTNPDDPWLPLGQYFVQVAREGAPPSYAGQLHVTSAPTVSDIIPKTAYENGGTFGLTFRGSGFSPVPDENRLFLGGWSLSACPPGKRSNTAAESRICEPPTIENGDEQATFCLESSQIGTTQITFRNIPTCFQGRKQVVLEVGGQASAPPALVTFASVGATRPRLIAVIWIASLILAIIGIVYKHERRLIALARPIGTPAKPDTIPGLRADQQNAWRRTLRAFLVDEETNTYSLTRLQLYLWTVASLFGYVYLTLCYSLVQGRLEFANVPAGLPTLLLTSVGTSVLSGTITTVKGSMGAGQLNPSLTDFFSHGGVVAPERLQFFLWTIVGVVFFIALTLGYSPETIDNLPGLPDGYLALSGISAAALLGGRLARRAGPKITSVTWQSATVLAIQGSELSAAATVVIRRLATGERVAIDGRQLINDKERRARIAGGTSSGATSEEVGEVVELNLTGVQADWLSPSAPDAAPEQQKGYLLTFTNPDGQIAEAWFS
jgi:hypothetical protein